MALHNTVRKSIAEIFYKIFFDFALKIAHTLSPPAADLRPPTPDLGFGTLYLTYVLEPCSVVTPLVRSFLAHGQGHL